MSIATLYCKCLACFRSQMLIFECVLLCFRSHMCEKPYKTWLRIVFVHMNSPNPLFYRCKFSVLFKNESVFAKPLFLRRFWKLPLRSAAGWRPFCFTLCVCFCVFPSLNQNENPIRSETSVREKAATISTWAYRALVKLDRAVWGSCKSFTEPY